MSRFRVLGIAVMLILGVGLSGCLEPPGNHLITSFPEQLQAEGWLHSEPLDSKQLLGKVVVIDCWGYWCGPCRQVAPELTTSYLKYRGQGVQFVGVTPDPGRDLPQIKAFIDKFDQRWPIAYGAGPLLDTLGVEAFPTLMVFDRNGKSIWNSFESGTLDEAIEQALANNS